MGLLNIDMNTPEGEGFNSALMAAAQALLTPRAQGGGMGAAFGAFPRAIERAQLQSQRARMLGMQEKQIGQQGQRMDFDMAQAQRKQAEQEARRAQLAQFAQTLPESDRQAFMMNPDDYFKTHEVAPGASLVRGGKTLFTAPPKPDAPPDIVKLMKERDALPDGHPWRPVLEKVIEKAQRHPPAANQNVYTGTMVPAEVDGQAGFVMPSKDGSVKLIPGIEPPGTAAKRGVAETDAATARNFAGLIDMALQHPGRKTATGLSSVMDPRNFLPGTDARSYGAIHKQLEGKAFLEAFQSLKGGGPITDVEGRKATEASVRLDTAQSDDAYEGALREARQLIADRYKKATGASLPQSPIGRKTDGNKKTPTISNDVDYNALPSGSEFIAPDGSRRRKP